MWMGPDQDLGYVVAKPIPGGNQPFPVGTGETAAYVGFSRSNSLTQASFVNLANQIAAGATSWGPTEGTAAKAWLKPRPILLPKNSLAAVASARDSK